jgi:ATP-dependent RNA helicase SUPV3L1/SUV3
MLGPENVGLITGEEQENPDAPVICATAEAAPLRNGGVLVIDECHWLSDPQRGWAWTSLLVGGNFTHVHAIADPAAAGIVAKLVPDAKITERIDHPRLAPLQYKGATNYWSMPKGSALVAFSRKAVLALAEALKEHGRKPAVLYGALPPIARAAQIERLVKGDADIIVTTDVIGHGINLPLTAVGLAETQKFDGETRRGLYLWEAAQILGRAGRYGHGTEIGATYSVTGLNWFTSPAPFIQEATEAAAGRMGTRWNMPAKAQLRPTLGELNVETAGELYDAVRAFTVTTQQAAEILPVRPFDSLPVLAKLQALVHIGKGQESKLPLDTIWNLAMCPVDDLELIKDTAGARIGNQKAVNRMENHANIAKVKETAPLERLEGAAAKARDLRAVLMASGDLPNITLEEAVTYERLAGEALVKALARRNSTQGYGKCNSCGKACNPWFTECDSCHHSHRRSWYTDDDWDY